MLTIEVNTALGENDISAFFEMVRTVINNRIEEDTHLRVYSWSWSSKKTFDLIRSHFRERLGDIANVKKASKRVQCGFELYGIEIKLTNNNMELFHERVNELFKFN